MRSPPRAGLRRLRRGSSPTPFASTHCHGVSSVHARLRPHIIEFLSLFILATDLRTATPVGLLHNMTIGRYRPVPERHSPCSSIRTTRSPCSSTVRQIGRESCRESVGQ